MSDGKWMVLIRTDNGVVSLMKDLTETEARQICQRLRPQDDPWTVSDLQCLAEQRASPQSAPYRTRPALGTYGPPMRVDAWNVTGERLEVWPKPADWDARLEEAIEVAKRVAEVNQQIAARRSAA